MNQTPKYILPIIVLAQFCGTSLWFAGNAVASDLGVAFSLPPEALSYLTSAVQFGFIIGTLTFALLMIADRFSPSRVFFVCAIVGALFNVLIIFPFNTFYSILFVRFIVGVSLAGIYPVGMKIASDYYSKGLGKSLGFLVGALVLGTAAPHLLTGHWPWKYVMLFTSSAAAIGGALVVVIIPDGPFRVKSKQFQLAVVLGLFRIKSFRNAAFGYFGHMWELYAFWAFVPVILMEYAESKALYMNDSSLFSFSIIAIGAVSCVLGGILSNKYGVSKIAFWAVLLSGLCCLLIPFVFGQSSFWLFYAFMLFWGAVVIPDSPLFSSMVASGVPAELRGTALTIVNCIGFSITIISIQLLSILISRIGPAYSLFFLGVGPIVSVVMLLNEQFKKR